MTWESHIDLTRNLMVIRLRNFKILAALLYFLLKGGSVSALETSPSARSNSKLAADPSAEVAGFLGFEGAKFQSPIAGQSQLDQSLLAIAQLTAQKAKGSLEGKADLKAQKYLDWGGSHAMVSELYASYLWNDRDTQLTLGRKKQFWSQMDQTWDLEMWQPKDTFDGLRPETQGLIGLFGQHQEGKIGLLVFATSFYVPSMGPDIEEENGQLVSNNRWYRSPSPTFLLMSKEHQAFYSLDIPEIEELIQQPAAGSRLCYGCGEKGVFLSGSYGYKPMNTLLVKYTRWLYVTEEDSQENIGAAPVVPAVGYHYLAGADLGFQFEKAVVSVSYLEDRPEELEQSPEDRFIVQRANPMKAYSTQIQMELDLIGFEEPVGMSLGYLRIHGGDVVSFDAQGRPHESPFTQRFNFTNAASVQLDFSSHVYQRKWTSRVKYLRDFDQKGMLGNAEISFYPKAMIAFTLGADVLGVDDSSDANKDDGFLNSFRANDRVYGGISYVF